MNNNSRIPFILSFIMMGHFIACSKKVDSTKTYVPVKPGSTAGSTTGDDDFPDDDGSSSTSSSSSTTSYSCTMGSSNPVSGTTNTSATLYFSCIAPSSASYQCRIGTSASWIPCTSTTSHTQSGLTVGSKRFEVRTRSSTGTTYASTFYEWTIAALPANVQTQVQDSSRSLSPLWIKMNFTSSGGVSPRSSQCQISGDSMWQNCSSPWTVPGATTPGANFTFSVKSTDANGNVSPIQTRSWTNGNWPAFPSAPALSCGQTIVYQRNCTSPAPSVWNDSTTLTGLACQGDQYKSYTRTCGTIYRVATTSETTIGNLRTWNQDCSPTAPQSLDFRDAIMKYCTGGGWHAGWGPVNVEPLSNINASPVRATCYTSQIATALYVPNSALTSANSACTPASNATSYACHMASFNYCRSLGHAAGFGVIRRNSSGNQIVCMKSGAGQIISTNITSLNNVLGSSEAQCLASDPLGVPCRKAAHYFCRAQSADPNYSGIGLYNVSGNTADVFCGYYEKEI